MKRQSKSGHRNFKLYKRGLHLAKRAIGKLLGQPHKSGSAYDKLGKELVEKAMRVNVIDAPEA